MTASSPKSEDEFESSNSAVSEPSLDKSVSLPVTRSRGGRGKKNVQRNDFQLIGNQGTSLPLSIAPNGSVQYQTSNGILSVLAPFSLSNNNNQGVISGGSGVDMASLAAGTTVIMTQDGQQFLIPVSLGNDGNMQAGGSSSMHKSLSSPGMNSNSSSGSSNSGANNSSMGLPNPNLTPQQQVMAEEAGRKREVRLLKNREAAKECRRKKKEYIKCLENRVAVLENQNKALIEELKSLKELYCKSTTHD